MSGLESLNAVVAPDSYTAASTIENVDIARVIADVTNQPILWQLKIPAGGGSNGNWDGTETYMLPGSRKLPGSEGCVGIRFKAAIPASQIPAGKNQAVVTIMAVTK